jgi:hypothetical protein
MWLAGGAMDLKRLKTTVLITPCSQPKGSRVHGVISQKTELFKPI